MDKYDKVRSDIGDVCRENVAMSSFTTLKIGGPARLLVVAKSANELTRYIKAALKYNVDFVVLGSGSDLLVNDAGYNGLVIVNKTNGIKMSGNGVLVDSGTTLQNLVDFTINKGFAGMESMTGIPGTVGGAVYGNAGAYGQTISDNLVKVKASNGGRVFWKSRQECNFDYRSSVFKKTHETIIQVKFEFPRGDPDDLRRKAEEILALRRQKYAPDLKTPGSFFKNILLSQLESKTLEMIPEEKQMFGKVPAGYLLEVVGAKGMRRGGAQVAPHHGNLIVNVDRASAQDFFELAKELKARVKNHFGVELEPEVQLLGFKESI